MLMRSIIVSFVCYGYAQSCVLCLIVYIFNKIKAITTLSNVLKKTTFHKTRKVGINVWGAYQGEIIKIFLLSALCFLKKSKHIPFFWYIQFMVYYIQINLLYTFFPNQIYKYIWHHLAIAKVLSELIKIASSTANGRWFPQRLWLPQAPSIKTGLYDIAKVAENCINHKQTNNIWQLTFPYNNAVCYFWFLSFWCNRSCGYIFLRSRSCGSNTCQGDL